jgi:phosphoribosyl 1,2-cyclic phosphate phosphodiesterase
VDVPGRARLLVDTATDLRQQALTHRIAELDAVLFTHAHADHVLGFDELRRFNVRRGGPIPAFASAATWGTIRRTFHYAFDGVARQAAAFRASRRTRSMVRSPCAA